MNDADPRSRPEPESDPARPEPAEGTSSTSSTGGTDDGDGRSAPCTEEALRRLLRDTVRDIEPDERSLEHLRRAVPERRRRRRHLLLGTAASVALLAVATPVAYQAANPGGGTDHAGGAGEGHATEGAATLETADGSLGGGELGQHGGAGEEAAAEGEGSATDQDPSPDDQRPGERSEGGWETLGATVPTCLREQLGGVRTALDEPGEDGAIRGSVALTNVSDEVCRVEDDGELVALPAGNAFAPSDVQVVDRTEGDRSGLPAPEEAHSRLVLPPGEGYEVQFAWLPGAEVNASTTCSVPGTAEPVPGDPGGGPALLSSAPPGAPGGGGGEGGESPDEEDPAGSGGGGGGDSGDGGQGSGSGGGGGGNGGGNSGGNSGDGADGGGSSEDRPGLLLRYTPAAGEPSAAQLRLEGVCAGTVYRTGLLEAPSER